MIGTRVKKKQSYGLIRRYYLEIEWNMADCYGSLGELVNYILIAVIMNQ